MNTETLIEFPVDIAVKAMGLNEDDFESLISATVLPLIEPTPASITTLPSRNGKYLSVRVHFTASSLEQLQEVYIALRSEARVLFTL
jgi:putative lipoic acid-binding regulatory protein